MHKSLASSETASEAIPLAVALNQVYELQTAGSSNRLYGSVDLILAGFAEAVALILR